MKNNMKAKIFSMALATLLVLTTIVSGYQVSVYAEEISEDAFEAGDGSEELPYSESMDAFDMDDDSASQDSVGGDTELPLYYGYEQFKDYMPPLVSQGKWETCWAISAIQIAEISMLKQGYVTMDSRLNLSETHLSWFAHNNTVVDPLGGTDGDSYYSNGYWASQHFLERGGRIEMAAVALSQWCGPTKETNQYLAYPKGEASFVPDSIPSEYAYLSDVRMVGYHYLTPQIAKPTDPISEDVRAYNISHAKRFIMKYGAVAVRYITDQTHENYSKDKNSLYNEHSPYLSTGDHVSLIVGWDDNFSKNDFLTPAPGDGAWLIRNSWATKPYGSLNYGDPGSISLDGYFWLSYYDDASFDIHAFDFRPGDSIDHNYQMDGAYWDKTIDYGEGYIPRGSAASA